MASVETEEKGISLLYVEDEQDTREEICEIIGLRYPELQLLVAGNGKTGLGTFAKHQPEIVITDINMPFVNGIAMAAEIKALCPATEIIALTAYSNSQHLLQAIEIGISHYILKPINVEQIFNVLDKTLNIIRSARLIEQQNSLIRDLNQRLVQKTAKLELANRELESFNYTVAHDLRSPMVSISGYSELLLERHAAGMNDTGREYLQIIHQEISRMNGLIDVLLKFSVSSRKQVEKKWTSLSGIAHEISNTLQVQEPVRRVTFCIDDEINGYGEPGLLHIVLENLLGNAWKYSVKRDNVRIEFGTINRDDDLVYFVRDNGAGFDQQDSDRLFTPFQRLECDDEIEGFGIGLATVSRIIQRHGGRIWAEGEKGKGATFFFTL